MQLEVVAALPCGQGSCPTIYVDHETDTVIVQGYAVAAREGQGSDADALPQVMIPGSILRAARDRVPG